MRTVQTWDIEKQIYEEAEQNLGLFLLKEWRQAGLSDDQLRVRRKKGYVHRIFNGVMALASAPRTQEFRILAGAMRAGPLAAGCGVTAAAKLDLMPTDNLIHIATTRRIHGSHPGYRFHRVALRESEIIIADKAPITDPLRTMLDACAELHPLRMARMYNRAKRLGLFDDQEAAQRCESESRQGRAGITMMRELISANLMDLSRLASDNEARFVRFLEEWGFPPPLRNIALDTGGAFPWRPDFFWPSLTPPLVVELDDPFTHRDDDAWDRDHEKTLAIEETGIRVVRITTKMMNDEATLARRLRPHFGQAFS